MTTNLGIKIGVEGTAQAEGAMRQMAGAMQSLTAATEKTRAEMQAAKAAFEGWNANNTALPTLNKQIKDVGISAGQTANAMRMIPMQMTDIVVSLGSGQSPFTVLLQQGGQLKDSFGGVGAALRATAGYAAGLVNPFSIAAAAVGTLGLAYYKGSQEADAFNKTIALTGNAVGASASQMAGIAATIGGTFGTTVGKAAEAINLLAATGQVGRTSLGQFAATAVEAEKVLGLSLDSIAKNIGDLGKDPVGASARLTETMNYLTASTYEQIKAAKDLGQNAKAAALAQGEYDQALKVATNSVLQNLGTIEKAWVGVKDVAKLAWDAMLGVGREQSIDTRLKKVMEALKKTTDRQAATGQDSAFAPVLASDAKKQQEQIDYLKELQNLERRAADAVVGRNNANKEGIAAIDALTKANTAALSKQEQLNNALKEYRKSVEVERGRNPDSALIKPEQIAKTEAAIRAQYKEAEKAATVFEQLSKRVGDFAAQQNAASESQGKLTEGQRMAVKITEDMAAAGKKLSASEKERLQASLNAALATEQRVLAEREVAKFLDDSIKLQAAAVAQADKSIESTKKQAAAEREAMASIGLSKEAIAELTAAKYDDSAASKERLANIMAEAGEPELLIKKYREEAAALRDLAVAKRERGTAETGEDLRKKSLEDAKKSLQDFDTLMGNIDLSKMNGMFNGAADGALKFVTALNTVAEVSGKVQKALEANDKLNSGDPAKLASEQARITAQAAGATVSAYGTMAGALKGYAKEGSKAYNALYTAEKIFRAFELASAVSNMATKSGLLTAFVGTKVAGDAAMTASATTNAGAEIAATTAVTAAKATAAVVNQGGGDPYSAFPRIAAMAAIMAALGFATGAIGGGSTAAATNSGTGTVFGDSSATSESLSNSLDLLNDTQDIALTYSKAMAASLRTIESSIGGFTNIYLRSGGTAGLTNSIATGKFDTGLSSTLKFGKEILGPLGSAFGSIITSLFGKKISITGSGISANDQALGDILSGGFQGNTYADVNTKKKFFGITTSSKNSTQLGDLDPALARQITAIFSGVGSAIGLAADLLGQDTLATQQKLQDYVISIGRIDLKDLKGAEIAEKLGAVFGAESDKIAASVIPGFERLQAVGEGYFETLTRVAKEFETVNVYMARLGDTLGQVGIAGATAADDLVQAFGGLDAFQSAISDYYDTFYTEAERNAQTTKELGTAFAGLGKSMPTTLQGFRDLVNAQDLTTQAGRSTYAALISLAPAFAEVTNAADDAAKALADAASEAAKAVADQRSSLQGQLDQAQGNTAAIRARELAALDPSNRALQQRIYLLADEEAAMQASVRNTDAALAAVRKSVDAEKTLQQVRVTAAQEQVNTIKGVFDTLDSAISSLLGNAATSAADGENFITQALSAARTTGYLPDQKDLSNAITAATGGLASKVYASAADQEADRLRLAAKLTDLKGVAGDQLTAAELTLKNSQDQLTSLENIYTQAQQQVNILRGIDTTAKTIPEALSLLGTTLTAELRAVASAAAAGSASAAAAAARQPYSVNDTPAQRQSKVEAQTGVALSASDTALVAAAKVLYQSINGGASTAAYNAAAAAVGGDIARAVGWDGSREGAENLRKVYGFASGGTHTGGLRLVGENGPELEVTGPSRIYSADQTRAMLQGGNSQRLELLVEGLTKEVQRLQAITQDGTREARRTAEATNGNPEQPMLVQTV